MRVECVAFCVCVFQAEGRVGGSGGESPAAADGDNSGDAGGPAGRRRDSREEEPGRLGRYTSTATLQELQFTRKKKTLLYHHFRDLYGVVHSSAFGTFRHLIVGV